MSAAPLPGAPPVAAGLRFYFYSTTERAPAPLLRRIAAACVLHAASDLCPAWNMLPPAITVVGALSDVPHGGIPVGFMADIGDPQAAAYHSVDRGGIPLGRVQANDMTTDADISVSASHEVWESLVDLYCAGFELHTDAAGTKAILYAREIADAVEGTSFDVDIGDGPHVTLSNWCTPAWFTDTPPPGARFDYLGRCTAPWQIVGPDGYAVTIDGGRVLTLPEGRALKPSKMHPSSRAQRRIAAAWRVCGPKSRVAEG